MGGSGASEERERENENDPTSPTHWCLPHARRKGQIPQNDRPGAQARKASILNKKLIAKHACQEEGPDPRKWPPRYPGPEIVDS